MKAYILPEMREKFEKAYYRACKHLNHQPTITFSKPMEKMQQTVVAWKCDGEHGIDKYRNMITVIEVEIEDITSGDWVLVADVHYDEGIVGMVNAKLYKDIPSQFGLGYTRCDYCGHKHPNRIKAHIVYNTVTHEWKQIGTSCGKKMFEAGDLCKFTVKLYEVFQQTLACVGDENWGGWCGRIPDHSWQKAYDIDSVIATVVRYRKEVNQEWQKSGWDESRRCKISGTTDFLYEFYRMHSYTHDTFHLDGSFDKHYEATVIDADYNAKVKAFVDTLVGSTQLNEWNEEEPDFNAKIKSSFENGYILSRDFYTVFFAVKMYEESLTMGDWNKLMENYPVGEKVAIRNARIASKEYNDGFYGAEWFIKFIDERGVTIQKKFTSIDSLDKYKNEDDTYSFMARVDYINNNKRTVRVGGAISRLK